MWTDLNMWPIHHFNSFYHQVCILKMIYPYVQNSCLWVSGDNRMIFPDMFSDSRVCWMRSWMFSHFSHIHLMKIYRELDELENTKYKLTFWINFGSKAKLRDHSGFQLAGVC